MPAPHLWRVWGGPSSAKVLLITDWRFYRDIHFTSPILALTSPSSAPLMSLYNHRVFGVGRDLKDHWVPTPHPSSSSSSSAEKRADTTVDLPSLAQEGHIKRINHPARINLILFSISAAWHGELRWMWQHPPLTGWNLKTQFAFWPGCCQPCLETGKLLWSTFPLKLHFNIIRDLSVLRVIFPHKNCQLLTLLIFFWTTSLGEDTTAQPKGQEKPGPKFLFEK